MNVNGGAIAMGHPLGATGAMLIGTLIDGSSSAATSATAWRPCIGIGMGIATIIERVRPRLLFAVQRRGAARRRTKERGSAGRRRHGAAEQQLPDALPGFGLADDALAGRLDVAQMTVEGAAVRE
ncbi:MAG: hypothetical protein U0802_23805 [Candidatus Binatia bacterium]